MAGSDNFSEGIKAFRNGQFERAAGLLMNLTRRHDLPGQLARHYCAMAHRSMGIESIEEGRYDQAANHLRQAVALVGNSAQLAEYLLIAYAGLGQYDKAAAEADVVAQAHPGDAARQVQLAQAYWRAGQRTAAYQTLTESLRRLGDQTPLHLHLGLFHASEDDYPAARGHFRQATECDCTCTAAFRYLGLAEAALGDYAEAARAFGRAWTLAPQDMLTAYQLCLAADAAAKAGRPVTVKLPGPMPPTANSQVRQLAEYAAGNPEFIESFLALPPNDADEELLGLLLTVLRTAVGCHDGYADLHYYSGVVLSRLGQHEQARASLERAVAINPRYIKALLQLAETESLLGLPVEAASRLEAALAAGADWPDVHTRLGDLLRRIGRPEAARTHYRRALQLNMRYGLAADGMSKLAA